MNLGKMSSAPVAPWVAVGVMWLAIFCTAIGLPLAIPSEALDGEGLMVLLGFAFGFGALATWAVAHHASDWS